MLTLRRAQVAFRFVRSAVRTFFKLANPVSFPADYPVAGLQPLATPTSVNPAYFLVQMYQTQFEYLPGLMKSLEVTTHGLREVWYIDGSQIVELPWQTTERFGVYVVILSNHSVQLLREKIHLSLSINAAVVHPDEQVQALIRCWQLELSRYVTPVPFKSIHLNATNHD